MTTSSMHLKRAGAVASAIAALALFAVPSASSVGGPQYPDAASDSGSAPDIAGVTVAGDKGSGQLVFAITGANLSASENLPTLLAIDSDANPLTGDSSLLGADYLFVVDDTSYGFGHWDGTQWAATSDSTVRVAGGGSGLLISVNRSELGNASDLNFAVLTLDSANRVSDEAPDHGLFNYSIDAGGPLLLAADVKTAPASGPRAGRAFVVTANGLKLPPGGAAGAADPKPESYACKATLKGRALAGTGAGGCTFRIPKKKTHGKALRVVLTVTYEGATKAFPLVFHVN